MHITNPIVFAALAAVGSSSPLFGPSSWVTDIAGVPGDGLGSFVSSWLSRDHKINDRDRRGKTIGELIERDDRLSRFQKTLQQAGRSLQDDLYNKGSKLTVFAWTDDAWREHERHRRDDEDGHDASNHHKKKHQDEDPEKILRYHIVRDHALHEGDFYDGQVLETHLKLESLGGQRQRIRVFKYRQDAVFLNMQAHVKLNEGEKAENGELYIVDRVLHLPIDLEETFALIPTEFSTLYTAAARTGLLDELREHEKERQSSGRNNQEGLTVLAPNNAAWKNLGYHNLAYLFSDRGINELKKIVQYHIGTELHYSPDFIKDRKVNLRTLHGKRDVEIEARRRHHSNDRSREADEEIVLAFGGEDKPDRGDGSRGRSPHQYLFTVNDGEARIVFTDGLSGNGVLHVINNVLIPDDVQLPSDLA
ncbi:FAS1 domain-containing protein [Cladochytrium replicatum]|nr:FAS1 domain-containing protein [Cladochytrium replicatum]